MKVKKIKITALLFAMLFANGVFISCNDEECGKCCENTYLIKENHKIENGLLFYDSVSNFYFIIDGTPDDGCWFTSGLMNNQEFYSISPMEVLTVCNDNKVKHLAKHNEYVPVAVEGNVKKAEQNGPMPETYVYTPYYVIEVTSIKKRQ